jgi:hypothetical protein
MHDMIPLDRYAGKFGPHTCIIRIIDRGRSAIQRDGVGNVCRFVGCDAARSAEALEERTSQCSMIAYHKSER